MKIGHSFKLLFLSVLFLFLSCENQQESPVNPIIETAKSEECIQCWVSKNKQSFSTITRKDIINLPTLLYTQMVLAELTPTQKTEIWHEKLELLLKTKKWNAKEKEFINEILKNTSANDFDINGQTIGAFEIQAERWRNYALDELKWSELDFFLRFELPHLENELPKHILEALLDYKTKGNATKVNASEKAAGACQCRNDLSCAVSMFNCEDGGCTSKRACCGFFGNLSCSGKCETW